MIFKNKKNILAASISVLLMAGCANNSTIPDNPNEEFEKSMEGRQRLVDDWKVSEPAITYINDEAPLMIERPMSIPQNILEMPFSSSLTTSGKISDLAGILKPLGIFVAIPEKDLAEKPLVLFEFEGKLGDFLSAIGSAYRISFNWNDGNIITIDKESTYMVKVPQNEDIASAISKNLSALGAQKVDTSLSAGLISYSADFKAQKRIENFMTHVSENSALVSMQIAVITVDLSRNKKTGIDWSQLNFALGEAAVTQRVNGIELDSSSSSSSASSSSGTDSGSEGSSSSSSSTINAADLLMKGSGLDDFTGMGSLGGNGANFLISKNDFAVGAVFDYLSTFGQTETSQSVLMKTISGKDVKLKSASEIPFVKSVGVSNLTSGGSGSSSEGDSSSSSGSDSSGLGLGTAEVETVDVGLDLSLSPYYQARSNLVTIDVELKLSSLLSIMNLSAGNQLGTITHPNIQEQEFTDLVKVRAGDTVVIGGITYDQKGDNRNAPSFIDDVGGAHVDANFRKNAMVIMIRPSVTVFKHIDSDTKIIAR